MVAELLLVLALAGIAVVANALSAFAQQARFDLSPWNQVYEILGDRGAVRISQRMTELVIEIVDRRLIVQVLQTVRAFVQFGRRRAKLLQVGFP